MGYFDNIENVRVGAGGVYFLPGTYVVEIDKCFTLRSRKGDLLVIVECEIIKSDVPARQIGSHASWVVNLSQDAALGNIKGFLAAVNGIDPADEVAVKREITTALAEYAFGPDNPLAGGRVALECSLVQTRKGTDFTRHFWDPMEQPTEAEKKQRMEQRRAASDEVPF